MKRKVYFVLSSFGSGGAERVFWLLCQNFDKSLFDITVVLLSTTNAFFSTELSGIKIIDLKSVKASNSFFKLCNLLKSEKPDVVFSTGGEINLLVGMVSLVVNIPTLIARPTNQDNSVFLDVKAKFLAITSKYLYSRFHKIVCQSEEIKSFVEKKYNINPQKCVVIPNPVVLSNIIKNEAQVSDRKGLIIVARLTEQKGISRLLQIVQNLPLNYYLTIVGDGKLRTELTERIVTLGLSERVTMVGKITHVLELIAEHDLFVLPSFIEGFPNAVIEALSVGTPVVSFRVGGISEIIVNDFNGFILEQNDIVGFESKVLLACGKKWDTGAIRKDVYDRFSIENVTRRYQNLIPA